MGGSVVAVVAAIAVVLGVRRSGPPDAPPSKPTWPVYVAGPELRTLPAETVTDATGARVRVPERKVADAGKLFWRTIPVPPELKGLTLDGPVRRSDHADNLTIRGQTTVELPCEKADAAVLVRGTLGLWIALPSEAVTLDDGQSARRVVVEGEPTPWLFALTTDSQAGQPAQDELLASIVRFEQRHWTSKSLSAEELAPAKSPVASATSSVPPHGALFAGVAYAQDDSPQIVAVKRTLAAAWFTLRRISSTFHDEATLQRMRMSGNDPVVWSWSEYRAGIGLLSELRRIPRASLEAIRFADRRPLFGSPVNADPWNPELADARRPPASPEVEDFWNVSSRQSALFLLETLSEGYAPWGIETVQAMIDSSPSGSALFDLRVLEPMGNLNFVDVTLPSDTALPAGY
ncbi:MAG: hypothetical protein IT428_08440 [Planctomycetaceae bacterium]|nr:hypothetical protein [Planctomycetaceae bacterium]